MSEDATTPNRSRRNADRRTPRFSWNLAYEDTFFRSLCESMQMGFKENHSFKSGAWERAAIALRDKHGAYPEKSHLINKADNARKKFRMWRGLKEDPDFLYNPNTRTLTAPEEAWRRHFDREPLTKALRGRPFEHEEYMEILFPDVIGSGGAPKRIMKSRRRDVDEPNGNSTPATGNSVLDLSLDNPFSQTSPQQHVVAPPPQPAAAAAPPSAPAPTTTYGPPRTSVASSSALTPPDEQASASAQNPNKRHAPEVPAGQPPPPQRRRGRPSRFATHIYANSPSSAPPLPPPSAPAATAAVAGAAANNPAPPASTPRGAPVHASFGPVPSTVEEGLQALAEALRSRAPPKWPEQAMEIFFRDFADEDADLQLKIAEKALTDDNKAMVFVKMTPTLRQHWVGRLREVHQRTLVGGAGGRMDVGNLGVGSMGESVIEGR